MGVFSNMIDSVVAAVSPEAGLKRAAARRKTEILNSGYGNYGASTSKKSLIGWMFGGGSEREDISDNLDVLRQRSRDLYMGVPLAAGAIKTVRTNAVGRGLKVKPMIDRDALNMSEKKAAKLEKQIAREFALWADSCDCDMMRIDNFYELQQLAFVNWLMSGDCLAVLPVKARKNQPYDLRVNLIEADRLCSPNYADTIDNKIVGGVEVSSDGEIVAYHFATHHPLSRQADPIKWVRVPAYSEKTGRRNVLHIMTRERIGQRRGVPYLAPVIESLKQIGRYTDAELVAAVVSGMWTIFIEKEQNGDGDAIGAVIPDEEQIDADDDSTIEIAPGAVIDLNEGEKAHDVNPGRPNANFSGFVEAISQQIGTALEIPYEILVKRFQASYSASRGALEEMWNMISMYRSWLAADFCQPIYEEWLAEAVAKGRINAPGFFSDPIRRKAYCRAEWNGPAKSILDPGKEVQAAEKRVANGFSTRTAETMEMTGGDFYRNVEQLKTEERLMKEVQDIGKTDERAAGADNPADGANAEGEAQPIRRDG